MCENTTVSVAVRVRPLVPTEISKGCQQVLEVIGEHQQIRISGLHKDRAFTFNYVFSSETDQQTVYNTSVKSLIHKLFQGYNVTILAYGQTGSGKTHTMGTNFSSTGNTGVIPQALKDIFDFVKDNFSYDFNISVAFMELYKDSLFDLLSDKPKEQNVLEIREDASKGILVPNLTTIEVNNVEGVISVLEKGSLGRTTSATAMNAQSSRSHAICCINICMTKKENCNDSMQAKLYLVDLAGSERVKKTHATGDTFKEGVDINKGLLALGNCISCLGDEKNPNKFVPYRDHSLTRLLKDSLGGNSITLMIACVSPADYNIEETLSTLQYADRAKKIKNKPIVNQDPMVAQINTLKKTVQLLRLQIIGQGGPAVSCTEVDQLKRENEELKIKKRDLNNQLAASLSNNTDLHEKNLILQNANEVFKNKLLELKERFDVTLNNVSAGFETNNTDVIKENLDYMKEIKKQFNEINDVQEQRDQQIDTIERNKHNVKVTNQNNEEDNDVVERQELHANQQYKLNVQLTDLEKELNVKEFLAKQLMSNNQYVIDTQALELNEAKITQLEQEKEELVRIVKGVGNTGNVSEQRRKRVQELEKQIVELKKKVQEQNYAIKQKAKAEERVRILNQEIIQMKQLKVKLVKTMREDSDKFRQWKLQKERECIRLKREDTKKEVELKRMKQKHEKQQNVFKRRVEEAEAVNKRLKQVLALKQQTQEAKNNGKIDKLEPWLKQELDLYVNLIEAETTLKVLLEDRATLQSQLDELKNNSNSENNSVECKAIEDDLELRSTQIQDLQQRLLESKDDTGIKMRVEKLQAMGELKFVCKFLLARTAESERERVSTKIKLSETQEMYNEAMEKLNNIKKLHSDELNELIRKYDEEILILQQVNESNQERIKQEYDKKIEELTEEKKNFSNLVEVIKNVRSSNSTGTFVSIPNLDGTSISNPNLDATSNDIPKLNGTFVCNTEESQTMSTPVPVIGDSGNPAKNNESLENIKEEDSPITPLKPIENLQQTPKVFDTPCNTSSEMFDIDDTVKDPDWKKTPLGRRILKEKSKIALRRETLNFNVDDNLPIKRTSEGGCKCKTYCRTARCGCRKLNKMCQVTCSCNSEICLNQEKSDEESNSTEPKEEFKKPGDYRDVVPRKRIRSDHDLFGE